MGRSAGVGSPLFFHCPQARKNREYNYVSKTWDLPRSGHKVVRTGNTKPRKQTGVLGLRNMHTSHEYICECGHRGWTTHKDILHKPLESEVSDVVD